MPDSKAIEAINNAANTALNRKTVASTNANMSMEDFYKIMAAQLKYQDPSSPTDTSDMLNQMTQMSMINSLENMNTMTRTSYATSMMGKEVTIAIKHRDKSQIEEVRGKVTGVNLSGRETTVWVNGKEYNVSQIMQIGEKGKEKTEKPKPTTGTTTSGTAPTASTTSTTSTRSAIQPLTVSTINNTAENRQVDESNIGDRLTPAAGTLSYIPASGTDATNAMPPMTVIEETERVEETTNNVPEYSEQENKSKIITPVG